MSVDLGMPAVGAPGSGTLTEAVPEGISAKADFRWLMSSDVCKYCTHAACLDVCPTGSLFRTEFGTVVVQDDICNGCGVYGLPPDPVVTTRDLPDMWKKAGLASLAMLGGAAASFVGGRS